MRLLGGLEIRLDGAALHVGQGSARLRVLLAYLALYSESWHERSELAAFLWPRTPMPNARVSLRQLLARLRRECGCAGTPWLIEPGRVGLAAGTELRLDTSRLEGEVAPREERGAPALERMRQALAAYRGPFLADVELDERDGAGRWLAERRAYYRERATALAAGVANGTRLAGDLREALAAARQAVEISFRSEQAQQALLRCLLALGDYEGAVSAYQRYAAWLRSHEGMEVPEAVTGLVRDLLQARSLLAHAPWQEQRPATAVYIQLEPAFDPEALQAQLHRLREEAEVVAARYGGFIAPGTDPYGVTLWFGYPRGDELLLVQALWAARELVAAVGGSAGVESGVTLVSGDSVQPVCGGAALTARTLAALALAGSVYLGPEAGQLAAGLLGLEAEGVRPAVAGRVAHCYRIAAGAVRLPERRAVQRYPLQGRVGERETLGHLWQAVRRGEGAEAVLVAGELGMGKSRLMAWLEEHVTGDGGGCLWAYGCARLQGTPFQPVREAVARLTGLSAEAPWTGVCRRLRRWLRPLGVSDPLAVELLAELLDTTPPPQAAIRQLGAGQRQARMQQVIGEAIQALASRRPLALILEDLQWLDGATRELLEELLAPPGVPGLLLVLTGRPEGLDTALAQRLPTLRLGALHPDSARSLAQIVAQRDGIPEPLRPLSITVCGGNPLFIEQWVKAGWRPAEGPGEAVPAGLRDILAERLDRLGRLRYTVLLAAQLGEHFTRRGLERAAAADPELWSPEGLTADLAALVETGVLAARPARGEPGYAFREPLLREFARDGLPASERRRIRAFLVQGSAGPQAAGTPADEGAAS